MQNHFVNFVLTLCIYLLQKNLTPPYLHNLIVHPAFELKTQPPFEILHLVNQFKERIKKGTVIKKARKILGPHGLCDAWFNRPLIIENQPWIIKYEVNRLLGAQLIRTVIEKHNLQHVAVPEKYIITIDKIELLCVQRIPPARNHNGSAKLPFSVEQIKDIQKVVALTGYDDLHTDNLLHGSDGKIYFIDTEDIAFKKRNLYYHCIPYNLPPFFRNVLDLFCFSQVTLNKQFPEIMFNNHLLTEAAANYLKDEITKQKYAFKPEFLKEAVTKCIIIAFLGYLTIHYIVSYNAQQKR
ncbi:hypothetical protein IPH25_03185 [bacterium]|nr:MAG: hypothetical protein IPG37_00175 [bacterium]QQR61470.1 MAG: hypothetical protein IPH25_03185 [bacterium]QQR63004.1 MAG: hypothetical protein IPH67_00825 [bacterium]